MTKICAFCDTNPATQTDSHIFTKSWSKSMMIFGNQRRVYKLGENNPKTKNKPTQDTSKESFIFCPVCENKIFANIFETPITNSFLNIAGDKSQFFWVRIKNGIAYRNYWRVNYKLFKQFVYLQLFRAHVSTLPDFVDINLSSDKLGVIKNSLKNDFKDLKLLVFTCDNVDELTGNIQFTTFIDKDTYIMWINEFIFILFFGENNYKLLQTFEDGYTFDNMIRIVPLDFGSWTNFKTLWLTMIKDRK